MARLADLYAGAALGSSGAKALGSSSASVVAGRYQGALYRRKRLLEAAIKSGKLSESRLGTQDRNLVRPPQRNILADLQNTPFGHHGGGGGVLGGVGGLFENLGSDIVGAFKGLPGGIYTQGKAIVHDIEHQHDPLGGQSEVKRDVIDPIAQQYSETYGHGPGHFFEQAYKHPLGPILDVATLASLGLAGAARAGATAVARAEPESTLARLGEKGVSLTSREGREPLHTPGLSDIGNELEREYTPRPVAKLGQRLLDVVAKSRGTDNPLYRWQYSGAVRKELRESHAAMDSMTASMTSDELRALRPIADLDPNESRALFFSKMGVGHPELLKEYSNMVDETLVDTEKMKELKNLGIDPAYIRANSEITPEVKLLVENPNDRMIRASDAWDRAVERGLGPDELGLGPEIHEARRNQAQAILLKRMGWEKGKIEPWFHGAGKNYLPERPEDWSNLKVPARMGEKRDLPLGNERRFTFHAGTEAAARHFARDPRFTNLYKLYPKNLRNSIEYLDFPRSDGGAYSTTSFGSGNHYWRVAEEMQNKTLGPKIAERLQQLRSLKEHLESNGLDPTKDRNYLDNARYLRGEISIANDVRRLKQEGKTGVAYTNVAEDEGSTSILGFNKEDWNAILFDDVFDPLKTLTDKNYVPMVPAENYVPRRGLLSKMLGRHPEPKTTGDFTYLGAPSHVRFSNLGDRALYAPTDLRAAHTSTGETFTTGTFRTDARVFLEHRVQVIRHTVDMAFKKEQVLQWAAKNADGEVSRFRTQADVDREFGRGKMVLVHDDLPITWYHEEIDHLKKVIDTIDEMEKGGMDVFGDQGLEDLLQRFTDEDARAFVSHNWGALRKKGVAVPRQIAEYQHQFGKLGNMHYGPVGRFLGRWMHRWRNAVLTFMPRWAFNTAAGSFLMAMVRGVTPVDFREASRLARTYVDPATGEQVTRPSFFERSVLRRPDINREGLESSMPHGVTLAHQAELEVMDNASASYLNQMGIRFPTRKLLHGVQAIEDYFRRAMFVTNLRREGRLDKAAYGGRDVEIPDVPEPKPKVPPRDTAAGAEPTQAPDEFLPGEDATVPVADQLPDNEQFMHHAALSSQLQQELDKLVDQWHASEPGSPEASDIHQKIQDKNGELDAVHDHMSTIEPDYMLQAGHEPGRGAAPTSVTMLEDLQPNDQINIHGHPHTVGDNTPDGWIYVQHGHHPEYDFGGDVTGYTHQEMNDLIDMGVVEHVKTPEGKVPEAAPAEANLPPEQEAQHDEAMQEVGHVLKDHYDTVLQGFRGNVAQALQNPEVVRRSLQETNKMMYNYMILGPFERMYVRQFVPFWGWYKFISQVAWRLPVEMPGRVNIMRWLGTVGNEQLNEFGPMPDWLKGVIPLSNVGDKQNFKYLSTLGMNPFGQFFNPLSTQTLKGAPSQLNPGIQAIMQAVGFDPLTGDRVRVSPQSGVSEDFFGRMYRGGKQVAMAEVEPGWRFAGSLLRSIPQVRSGQQFQSGSSVYPEDVPFIHHRPMGGLGGSAPHNIGQLGLSYFGVMPKTYDLQAFQQLNAKSAQYARQKNIRDKLRLRRKLIEQ